MVTKEEYNMNILVIGNGFDLAHKLPTKYENFLTFINHVNFNEKNKKEFVELYKLISNNIWIEYFTSIYEERKKAGNDGWIDFESEISKIIQSLNNDMYRLNNEYRMDDRVMGLSNKFLYKKYSQYFYMIPTDNRNEKITYEEIRDRLLYDLNKLIRALEIYLIDYVSKIQCDEESPDIKKIFEKKENEGGLQVIVDTKILNFNYTTTVMKVYKCNFDVDYIHGKADINNTIETNNMVLGIDEYLPNDRKNIDIGFIAFKKYYQRIYKQTGCKYKGWVDDIKKEYEEFLQTKAVRARRNVATEYPQHNLYIFGHSLDVTDKDILRDLILNDNVYTTIFYPDKRELGRKIANLVKIIGQDELIRRTGGSTKTIEFKLQQPMVPINN